MSGCRITVKTAPPGAIVYLDGRELGYTFGDYGVSSMSYPGWHRILATCDGYDDCIQNVSIPEHGGVVTLTLKGKAGVISVSTVPSGAMLELDGVVCADKTPHELVDIAHGIHSLRLMLTGYCDYETRVIAPAGGKVTVAMELRKTSAKRAVGSDIRAGETTSRIINGETFTFAAIPGGSFMMGSPDDLMPQYCPMHKVTLQPFKMQTTPVTVAQWNALMENKGHLDEVNWNECQAFVAKLNQLDPGNDYRLPSEAEWEYACRAGTTTEYNWGDDSKAGYGREENSWGLRDMHGSLQNWCQDWYHDTYNGAPSDGSPWEFPAGSERVLRGGWLESSGGILPSSCRRSAEPDYRGIRGDLDRAYGFRVVCR